MTRTDETLAVEAHDLVKTFKKNRAVDAISMSISTGSICAVLGPNGAGKTTTINMLATLLKPDSGSAKIFGYDVEKEAQKVRQLIGLTGQFASIDESLTAMENLEIFGRLLGLSRKEAKQKSTELLEEFTLTEAANKPLSQFSGGMRRRLDLASSLISQPPLIFLDEPTTGLDPMTRTQMWQTIRTLVKKGSTVLLTTQYLDEADQLADQIIVIDRGHVVANDTPSSLKQSIGAASMQVVLKDAGKITVAMQIIEKTLGVSSQLSEGTALTAPMDDTNKLTDVLTTLKESDIVLTSVNVRQPTLDEVFFALTGNVTKETKEAI